MPQPHTSIAIRLVSQRMHFCDSSARMWLLFWTPISMRVHPRNQVQRSGQQTHKFVDWGSTEIRTRGYLLLPTLHLAKTLLCHYPNAAWSPTIRASECTCCALSGGKSMHFNRVDAGFSDMVETVWEVIGSHGGNNWRDHPSRVDSTDELLRGTLLYSVECNDACLHHIELIHVRDAEEPHRYYVWHKGFH